MPRTLTVEGMPCGYCDLTVEEALGGVTGVTDATADWETEQVTVEGDAEPDDFVTAVEDSGYGATA